MSGLRRYIVGIVAVCVAFAAGIALGNGPLQGAPQADHRVALTDANSKLAGELSTLQHDQAFSEALGKAAGPNLLHGMLANTAVGVFVLPGVSPAWVAGVTKAVTSAGGELTVVARLSPTLVDPGRRTYVDSVAANSLNGVKDLAAAASLSPYGRIGTLMARAYTGHSDALAVDDEATAIDAQLQGAKLVSLAAMMQRRASAVIVLAPGDHGQPEAVYAAHQIELQVVGALAGRCDGLLVAAPSVASDSGGLLFEIAGSKTMTTAISTLNMVETAAGQVAAVGALASQLAGQPGAYGMRGAQVALPPALTSGG